MSPRMLVVLAAGPVPRVVAAALAAIALGCLARLLLHRGRHRAAWLCISAGVAAAAAGVAHAAFRSSIQVRPPLPPTPDLLVLAGYALIILGLLMMARRAERAPGANWLDGLVAGLGAAAGTAVLVLPALRSNAGTLDPYPPAIRLGYPAGDIVLAALLIGLPAAGFGPRRLRGGAARVLFAAGIAGSVAVLVAADWRPVDRVAAVLAGVCLTAAGLRAILAVRALRELAAVRHEALTDDLTGLGNRRLLWARLPALVAASGPRSQVALVLVGLDRFAEMTDALGHDAGDELLRQLGPRFRAEFRSEALVARLGGAEFVILTHADATQAMRLARAVVAGLDAPFGAGDIAVQVTASIGVAVAPDHASDAHELLRAADVARQRARNARSGVELYDVRAAAERGRALALAADLRTAVEQRQIELDYQPIVELRRGAVASVRAQARWDHPRRGRLGAAEFLPLAEQAGLVRRISLGMIDGALRQLRSWHEQGLPVRVAVGLGVGVLLDVRLPYDVARLLNDRGIHPSHLVIQVSEEALLADPTRTRQAVERLRTLGVSVGIVEYGRGASSLAVLRTLPVDELTLDENLVAAVTESTRDAAVVRAAIDLAHALGFRAVAAGVSSPAVAGRLYQCGCDLAHGREVCPPLPAEAVTDWLVRQGVTVAAPPPAPRISPEAERHVRADPALLG